MLLCNYKFGRLDPDFPLLVLTFSQEVDRMLFSYLYNVLRFVALVLVIAACWKYLHEE